VVATKVEHFHALNCRQSFVGIKFDMLMKQELSIEDEPKIFPRIFGMKNGASSMTEIERRQVEDIIQSRKMKDFSLSIFNYKTKLFKE